MVYSVVGSAQETGLQVEHVPQSGVAAVPASPSVSHAQVGDLRLVGDGGPCRVLDAGALVGVGLNSLVKQIGNVRRVAWRIALR
jgi:hypothetical protein